MAIPAAKNFTEEELQHLIEDETANEALAREADAVRRQVYGDTVFVRGLIEFTNYCRNNCYYCGIRKGNAQAERYRLTKEEILTCADEGYALGYRTFVLQGGEDLHYSDLELCHIVEAIKTLHPDCAVTLSVGERRKESYQMYFAAGADRYLLREETADAGHYRQLHPEPMDGEARKRCLWELKEIGYQVGAGFMVGSPFQTTKHLIEDLMFLKELQPDMIGIGPFITHQDTPFREFTSGELTLCLRMVAILRHLFPEVLLPATTALGTIHPNGRELGLLAGANVVMPNLSPVGVREKYSLYDNKICTGEEAAECRGCLENRVASAGFQIVVDRGDRKNFK